VKRSWLTLIAAPAVLLLALVVPFVAYWSSLPDPMAIHWGASGTPNGSASPVVLLVLLAGILVAMILAVRGAVARTPSEAPSFVAGLFAVGALLVGVAWRSVLANRDVAEWTGADEVGLLHVLVLVVVAIGAGWVGWLLADGRAVIDRDSTRAAPALDLADPANAVWSGRGVGKVITVIGVGVIVAGLVVWGWTAVALVVIGLVVLTFAVVRVTVSQRGTVISLGWWGYPTWTVPMESIVSADVEKVNPMAYGGWGYRLRPGVRAVVVRAGDSIRLVRDSGVDLVCTVDDAATGAGLINAMLGHGARSPREDSSGT
jgi:hypothetical protein